MLSFAAKFSDADARVVALQEGVFHYTQPQVCASMRVACAECSSSLKKWDSAGWTTKARAKLHGDRVVKILVGLAAPSMCVNVLKQPFVAARRAAWMPSQVGAIPQEHLQENNAGEMVDRSVGSSSSRLKKLFKHKCLDRVSPVFARSTVTVSGFEKRENKHAHGSGSWFHTPVDQDAPYQGDGDRIM